MNENCIFNQGKRCSVLTVMNCNLYHGKQCSFYKRGTQGSAERRLYGNEIEVMRTLKEYGRVMSKTATAMGMKASAVRYIVEQIYRRTGLDPREAEDLEKLLEE